MSWYSMRTSPSRIEYSSFALELVVRSADGDLHVSAARFRAGDEREFREGFLRAQRNSEENHRQRGDEAPRGTCHSGVIVLSPRRCARFCSTSNEILDETSNRKRTYQEQDMNRRVHLLVILLAVASMAQVPRRFLTAGASGHNRGRLHRARAERLAAIQLRRAPHRIEHRRDRDQAGERCHAGQLFFRRSCRRSATARPRTGPPAVPGGRTTIFSSPPPTVR